METADTYLSKYHIDCIYDTLAVPFDRSLLSRKTMVVCTQSVELQHLLWLYRPMRARQLCGHLLQMQAAAVVVDVARPD